MNDILPFLKSLLSVSGLSGDESLVANLIETKWTPLVDEIGRSRLGSVHGLKKGTGKSPRPSVLISTHMDAIGLMVARIVDEFLYITNIGSLDARVLPGTTVTVHATNGEELYGVIVMPPASLLPDGTQRGVLELEYLLVDTGLSAREISKRVAVGNRVSFNTEPIEMSGGCVNGHSIDNRGSVAALTLCLEELQAKSKLWDVWAVASVQEEITYAGAYTSTFQLRPTIAIALDLTYGQGAAGDHRTFPLGDGLTLGIGPSIHPFLHKRFGEIAAQLEIPVTDEAIPTASFTDADAMQLTAEGVPTMVVSIPTRYMHTPVEMIALQDIQRAGRLLAGFVASLEMDFIEKISWD